MSEKKNAQLGMNNSTAAHRLRKDIMFKLLAKLEENICYQCKKSIESANDLSVEHKIPWLDSEDPVKLFFDLDNIAFSHLSCNTAARRISTTSPEHKLGLKKAKYARWYTPAKRTERYQRTGR